MNLMRKKLQLKLLVKKWIAAVCLVCFVLYLFWRTENGYDEESLAERNQFIIDSDGNTIATDIKPIYGHQNQTNFPYNVLLLSSMGRSGSSFIGGLLKSQTKVLYIFEPFHDLEMLNLLSEESAVEGMKEIFTCNIQDPLISNFQSKPKFFFKNFYKECRKWWWTGCLTQEYINNGCRNKSLRVVKTIRTRVSWLKSIINDDKVNMKVIHLVRDPRASIISGWDRGWDLKPEICCDHLSDDLENGYTLRMIYPHRYMTVRYEDLCEKPWDLAKQIFSFLGYKHLPTATINFLKQSTHSDNNNPFSIQRNTKDMQQKWRSVISENHLKKIEGACANTIKQIGFHLFHGLAAVRNTSLPLFDDTFEDRLFNYDFS